MYGGKNRETKKPQPYKFEKQVICWTCTWHKLKKKNVFPHGENDT